MTDCQNFRDAVAGSDILKARWNVVADAAIESAAREGIVVTRTDLMTLDTVRLHILTGDEELGVNWRDEAEQKLPAFMQKAESRRMMSALKSENADQKASAEMEILKKNPAERMRIAREAGQQHAPAVTTKKNLSPEERGKAIAELDRIGLNGAARIQKVRELGLE